MKVEQKQKNVEKLSINFGVYKENFRLIRSVLVCNVPRPANLYYFPLFSIFSFIWQIYISNNELALSILRSFGCRNQMLCLHHNILKMCNHLQLL